MGIAAASALTVGYSFFEAGWFHLQRKKLPVRNLPGAFAGKTLALLTDFHHGPDTGLPFIRQIVTDVMATKPDLIVLGGDYVLGSTNFFAPVFEVLSTLRAPLGVYGVFGNHDHYNDVNRARENMKLAGIKELTNLSVPVELGAQRLWLSGVDDLWEGHVDVSLALKDLGLTDCSILLSHNPDVAEHLSEPRIGMILSGHTHGGQVVLPFAGSPWIPSHFGNKYDAGLKQYPSQVPVFISRGIGTTSYPVRLGSRPEANLLTLEKSTEV